MRLEPKQITPRLYQGGWIVPQDIPELLQHGITHILNLDFPYEDPLAFVEANLTLRNYYIPDYCLMKPQLVREVIDVIEESLSSPGHKLYLHCIVGVSRSPTISWLYLIHTGFSPEEASTRVKPNPVMVDEVMVQQLIANRPSFVRPLPALRTLSK